MTAVDLDRTLGDLVAELPARARVLEQRGIDYCCHGQRSLRDAAATAGLDAAHLAAELDTAADEEARPLPATTAGLIGEILVTHHAYLDQELPALTALADKVRDVHGGRHPELGEVASLVHDLRDDLEPHLRQEEAVVFPGLLRLAGGDADDELRAELASLASEHEQAGELLGRLRATTRDYAVPADGCASYRALYDRLEALERDTFRHIHLENNVLFPPVLGTVA